MRLSILASFSALFLAGCALPTPMPSGYTHHAKLYKSPPGPDAAPIGYDYTAKANAQVMAMWKDIARKFVDSVLSRHAISAGTNIHLISPYLSSAQTQSLDYALREDLTKRGFKLVARDASVLTIETKIEDLTYDESDQTTATIPAGYTGNPDDFQPRALIANITQNGAVKLTLREIHTVPDFGYISDHGGHRMHMLNPVTGRAKYISPEPLHPKNYDE